MFRMTQDLTRLSDIELRHKLKNARIVLQAITDGIKDRTEAQQVIDRLMDPGDFMATIAELSVKDPELVRLVMRASVMALANVQAVAAVKAELARRHSDEN